MSTKCGDAIRVDKHSHFFWATWRLDVRPFGQKINLRQLFLRFITCRKFRLSLHVFDLSNRKCTMETTLWTDGTSGVDVSLTKILHKLSFSLMKDCYVGTSKYVLIATAVHSDASYFFLTKSFQQISLNVKMLRYKRPSIISGSSLKLYGD